MSSLEIYFDTKHPELIAAIIDYYTGSIDVELYPVDASQIEEMSSVAIVQNGSWYNWTPCVDSRATLSESNYFKAMVALSKVKHLFNQCVEGNSSGDTYWSVGNSSADVDQLINTPLESIDHEIEKQLSTKLKNKSKLENELAELYRINSKINKSWKGKILRLLGVNLPDNQAVKFGGINAKGEHIYSKNNG